LKESLERNPAAFLVVNFKEAKAMNNEYKMSPDKSSFDKAAQEKSEAS